MMELYIIKRENVNFVKFRNQLDHNIAKFVICVYQNSIIIVSGLGNV